MVVLLIICATDLCSPRIEDQFSEVNLQNVIIITIFSILENTTNKPCVCDKNDDTWRQEEGFISGKKAIPITNFRISDNDGSKENSYLTMGPLTCKGKYLKTQLPYCILSKQLRM